MIIAALFSIIGGVMSIVSGVLLMLHVNATPTMWLVWGLALFFVILGVVVSGLASVFE